MSDIVAQYVIRFFESVIDIEIRLLQYIFFYFRQIYCKFGQWYSIFLYNKFIANYNFDLFRDVYEDKQRQ